MNNKFIDDLRKFIPDDARLMVCQFRGEPDAEFKGKWAAHVYSPYRIDDDANVYFCVSAMKKNERGEFRRRKENFAGGLCLMIDDIGTGRAAKFDMGIIKMLKPTYLIETSPNNHHALYMFDSLITDMQDFDGLIKSFIQNKFLGNDPGMAGVNRVFRPPLGVNGKPIHKDENGKPWRVRIADSWDERYSISDIEKAFGIKRQLVTNHLRDRGATVDRRESLKYFEATRRCLSNMGLMKVNRPDYGGWYSMTCPWRYQHSGQADTGAAIHGPCQDNGWVAGFKCHHGHCKDKTWRDITDIANSDDSEHLFMINANAGDFNDYYS